MTYKSPEMEIVRICVEQSLLTMSFDKTDLVEKLFEDEEEYL